MGYRYNAITGELDVVVTTSSGGGGITQINTDSGTITPVAGIISLVGNSTQGVSVSGAADTGTITVANSSTTQKGVVELATDAESIAGSSTTLVLTPSSLKAKLGSQTANAIPYGTGDSSAIAWTGAMTNGQLIIGSTLGNPTAANLLSTDGSITIANGSGTLALRVTQATESQNGGGQIATDAETKAGVLDTVLLTPKKLVSYNADKFQTGFLEWDGAGPYYSVAGTTLTLLQSGSGYIKGKKITFASAQNTGALTKGNTYLVYIDSTGTIGSTTSFTQATYEDYIPLFEILCDNDTPSNTIVVKENHPYSAPTDLSVYLHNTVGTVISNRNNGANITLNGVDEIEISGTDYLEDHGLETTVPDSGGSGETWNFYYTDAGGKWVLYSTTATFPSVYNNAGVIAALGALKFGVFHLYVSKDDLNSSTPTYHAVINTAQFNSQVAANTAIANGTIAAATNELFQLELCQLGYVVYAQSTSSITSVVIQKATVRGNVVSNTASTANLVTTTTTNFDGWLSASDTNVQSALETLDEVGKGVTPEHSVLLAGASYAITNTGVLTNGQLVIGNTGNAPSVASLTQPAAGLTITGGAGSITFALADDLAGIEALATTGLVSRTAANTYAATSVTQHAVLIGGASEVPANLGPLTNGQLVIGNTGNAPSAASLASGDGSITITPGAGTIDLAVAAGSGYLTYAEETGAAKTIVINYEYGANRAGGVAFTLPGTAAIGTRFAITGIQGNWSVAQGAGQYIGIGNQTTTVGAGGSLTAGDAGDCITCTCIEADLGWRVTASMGNITVA